MWTQDDSFNGKKQLLGPPSIEIGESSGCWNPTKEIALHTRIYRYIHFSSKWLDTYTFTYSKKLSHLKKKKSNEIVFVQVVKFKFSRVLLSCKKKRFPFEIVVGQAVTFLA